MVKAPYLALQTVTQRLFSHTLGANQRIIKDFYLAAWEMSFQAKNGSAPTLNILLKAIFQ